MTMKKMGSKVIYDVGHSDFLDKDGRGEMVLRKLADFWVRLVTKLRVINENYRSSRRFLGGGKKKSACQ